MKGFGYRILADMANRPNARWKGSSIRLEVTGLERPKVKGAKRKHAHPRLAHTYRGARRNLRRVMRVAELQAKRNAREPETMASSFAPHHHENVI